jgi:crotonobetainyl-CoA:carnitine CoA-transferase CaiB-like acyl-CoA transferase
MIHPQQPPENDQRATGELDAGFLDETPSRVQDPHELCDHGVWMGDECAGCWAAANAVAACLSVEANRG